ncbi:MAG: hypothetical protein EKK54_06055 [Neisseriaceae bacterium]|nr:MAG: hypothetical protein EKK54_06055 [Neisseriaceae bacterium]
MSDQTFEYNGYVLVGDLYWPTPPNNKAINLQKYKKDIGVNLYARVKGDNVVNYCVAKKEAYKKNIKKIVSLGAFLLNFYEDEPMDIIIVVKLADDLSGLVALKNGNVIPRGGDMIGDIETIRGRIIHLIDKYAIGNIYTAGCGQYYYDDKEIYTRLRNINPHVEPGTEETDSNGKPFKTIWDYGVKIPLKKSILRPIPTIDITSRKFLIIAGAIFGLLAIVLGVAITLNVQEDDVVAAVQPPPEVPTAMAANNFITMCFSGADKYFGFPGGWVLTDFSCNLKSRDSSFSTSYQSQQDLSAAFPGKSIVFSDINDKHFATLKEPLKPNFNKVAAVTPLRTRVELLQSLKSVPGVTAQVTMPINFTSYESFVPTSSNKIKFSITSQFSPLWFNKNQYFDGVLLSDVTTKYDTNTGLYSWQINGEITK